MKGGIYYEEKSALNFLITLYKNSTQNTERLPSSRLSRIGKLRNSAIEQKLYPV